jgi:hypothetical protein
MQDRQRRHEKGVRNIQVILNKNGYDAGGRMA